MNTDEKRERLTTDVEKTKIEMDYVTVRQSISMLLLRLIVAEILAAGGFVLSLLIVVRLVNEVDILSFGIPIFLVLVLTKIFLTVFIVLRWVEEYYKISSEEVVHKRGLIFKEENVNKISHLTSLEINQSFWGRVFNYGTIKMFNWATEKPVLLYLIHNPKKYAEILMEKIPEVDTDKKTLREHIFEED